MQPEDLINHPCSLNWKSRVLSVPSAHHSLPRYHSLNGCRFLTGTHRYLSDEAVLSPLRPLHFCPGAERQKTSRISSRGFLPLLTAERAMCVPAERGLRVCGCTLPMLGAHLWCTEPRIWQLCLFESNLFFYKPCFWNSKQLYLRVAVSNPHLPVHRTTPLFCVLGVGFVCTAVAGECTSGGQGRVTVLRAVLHGLCVL